MIRKPTAKRWSLALALLALGALALAGCGDGSSSSSESTTAGSSQGKEGGGPGGFDISDEQRSCLKEKGVELPEFKRGGEKPEGSPPGEGGTGGEDMQKAFEECGVEPGEFKGGPDKGGPATNSASFKKQVKEYAACVRENGFDLAEPNLSGEGPVFEKSESESAAFKQASAKCQDLLGGRNSEIR